MNYENMSDNEINEMVAELNGGYAGNVHGSESKVKVKDIETNGMFYMEVDYCNNPSDAWPIMHGNGIATVSENGVIIGATSDSQSFYDQDSCSEITNFNQNPLRAAMIVFLMMQEAKRG